MHLELRDHDIHIWSAALALDSDQINTLLATLSPDEVKRAERFRFPQHKQNFIAARGILRHLLGCYLNCPANEVVFAYTSHHKPYLDRPMKGIQFNLSHSKQQAVYAFTLQHAIGVDIEKISDNDHKDLSSRYFSPQENTALLYLPPKERIRAFYRIWSRKEAVIKAIGKGLSIPLSSFTVSADDKIETILLSGERWTIVPLNLHPEYQSALATNQIIKSILFWHFFDNTTKLDKITTF